VQRSELLLHEFHRLDRRRDFRSIERRPVHFWAARSVHHVGGPESAAGTVGRRTPELDDSIFR
jgi:hypothetical protein